MALYQKKNNALGAVNDNPLAAGATTLNLQSGQGANFPSSGVFLITVWDFTSYPNPGDDPNMEIMEVTSRSTDALTVVRAKESTSDVEHSQGVRVEMLITAGFFTDPTYGLDAAISPNFVDDETPSGSINGVNKTFTLANTPSSTALHLILQGTELLNGSSNPNGYSLSGLTITTVTAPPKGAHLRANYRY